MARWLVVSALAVAPVVNGWVPAPMPRTVGRKASRTTLCSSPWAGFGPRLGGGGLLLAATDSDEPSMEVVLPERAGPDAPEGYWDDPERIMDELMVFFKVREDQERRLLEEKAANPLRRYLGLSDDEQKRIRRRDSLIDRELYGDLRRYGFEYLVLPIMQQGGFRTFAQMISEGRDQPPRQAEVSGLALGQALEEKLAELSNAVSADPPKLSEKRRGGAGPLEGGMAPDSPEELDPTQWRKSKAAAEAQKRDGASWGLAVDLSNLQKLYVAVIAVGLAVGFGRSTGAAVDHGLLSVDVVANVRLAAAGGLVANLLSVPITAGLLAKAGAPLGRTVPLALRSALGGPVALWELRMGGMLDPQATTNSAQ